MMYSEKTLRRKAKEVGLTIEKGFLKNIVRNELWYPKQTGYSLKDDSGEYVGESSNDVYTHVWSLNDVEAFLRDHYKALGLKF